MAWTLCDTLRVVPVPVLLYKVLEIDFERFKRVTSSIISLPIDYVSEDLFSVDVEEKMIDNMHMGVACGVGVGGSRPVAWESYPLADRALMCRIVRPVSAART